MLYESNEIPGLRSDYLKGQGIKWNNFFETEAGDTLGISTQERFSFVPLSSIVQDVELIHFCKEISVLDLLQSMSCYKKINQDR